MINKESRIPRQKIPVILKHGETTFTDLFILKSLENNQGHNRYRCIVSKKISKKAVERNKLRRQIYETTRQIAAKTSTDIVIIPKKQIIAAKYSQLSQNLWKSLNAH